MSKSSETKPKWLQSLGMFLENDWESAMAAPSSAEDAERLLHELATLKDASRRVALIQRLGRMTEPAPHVITALSDAAANDENIYVRDAARQALTELAAEELTQATRQDKYLQARSPFEGLPHVVTRTDGTIVFHANIFASAVKIAIGLLGFGVVLILIALFVLLVRGLSDPLPQLQREWQSWLGLPVWCLIALGIGLGGLWAGIDGLKAPDVIFDPTRKRLQINKRFGGGQEFSFDDVQVIQVDRVETTSRHTSRYDVNRLEVGFRLQDEPYFLANVTSDEGRALVKWLAETLQKPITGTGAE